MIISFLSVITLPGVLHLITEDDDDALYRERRRPAPAPAVAFDLEALRAFPRGFEAYFDDHFRGRTEWVSAYDAFWLFGLGTSPSEMFVVGRDGFLFTTLNSTIEQHRGLLPLSAERARAIEDVLRWRTEWVRALGSRYVVVVGPNKHGIYPELLPEWAQDVHGPRPMDQLMEIAAGIEGAIVVDVRRALREAARSDRVCYEYGTHWNQLGAHIAYREVMQALVDAGMAVGALDLTHFDVQAIRLLADSWGGMLHLENALVQEGFAIEPREPVTFEEQEVDYPNVDRVQVRTAGPERERLRVLWVADSFGEDLLPYVQQHAKRVLEGPQYSFDPSLVALARPDVVLHVVVERHIPFQAFREHPRERAVRDRVELGPAAIVAGCKGTYVNPIHGDVELMGEGASGWLVQGGLRIPLECVGPTVFELAWKGPRSCVYIEGAPGGGPPALRLLDGESLRGATFVRSAQGPLSARMARWAGSYRMEANDWHVVPVERGLAMFSETGHWLGHLAEAGPDTYDLTGTRTTGKATFRMQTDGRAELRVVLEDETFVGTRERG
ncbi:MAG: hypothetical protein H6834_11965 [Planctomycetes bacterium]|nr:hypothetical protein [Planctomycetota bacterium]